MKKLYIPTSTLNFNNILSSESISPKAFYTIRGFGYSRWQEVEENNKENVILLYEEPFSFVRPDSDVEDHPMLLEITTDKDYPSIVEGVYYCNESIYLSPWRTRFIFFNEQDRRVALSISDSSLETKMLGLYHRQLCVETYPQKRFPDVACNAPLNKEAIDFDVRINKMKGLLYGYYIGALLSSTSELVEKSNTLQEIQNIFSSILSSDTHKPTILQHQKLITLFENLKKYDPIVSYLSLVIKESMKVEEIVFKLSGLGVVFPTTFDVEQLINSLESATENHNPALDWLIREKDNLNREEASARTYLPTSSEEIVLADIFLSKVTNTNLTDNNEQQLMKLWANDVLISSEYNGKITTFAEALSDIITRKAKDIYGEEWDDSFARIELNQMRRYIRGQESSITWKNDLFSSIAAVLAKGSDWEQLRSFMQSKQISDYRMAFAFYGELNGFANLTRDFTDNLFDLRDNRKYIAEVYKEIFGQLHGIDPTNGNTPIIENYPTSVTTNALETDKNDVPSTIHESEKRDLKKRIQAIIASHPKIKISDKDWQAINGAIDKAQNDDIVFINMVANEMESQKKGIFPHLQKELHPEWKPEKPKRGVGKKDKAPKEASLFGQFVEGVSKLIGTKATEAKESKSIIDDAQAVNVLNSCPALPSDIKIKVVELFNDFQKNYQSGYYYKNQDRYKRNNADVIDHFVKWCLSSKNRQAITWSPENSKLMDELKKYLTEIYGD